MDFENAIIQLLGIQDVTIEDFKHFRKQRRVEIRLRQKRSECFCSHCDLPLGTVKEWILREIKAPSRGICQYSYNLKTTK